MDQTTPEPRKQMSGLTVALLAVLGALLFLGACVTLMPHPHSENGSGRCEHAHFHNPLNGHAHGFFDSRFHTCE